MMLTIIMVMVMVMMPVVIALMVVTMIMMATNDYIDDDKTGDKVKQPFVHPPTARMWRLNSPSSFMEIFFNYSQ